jgi:predicted ATP-dependent endonuclease of OLD family
MFEKNFNIIMGLNNTGKTTLLRDLSDDFKNQLGYKVYWILNYVSKDMKNISELSINITNEKNNKYDIKSINILKEIAERGNIDYLFIDDYDILNDDVRNEINKIKCKKVVTTSHQFNDEILKTINNGDLDYLFLNKLTGVSPYRYTIITGCDDETYFVNDFRKILLRDKKINNLLDE